MKYPKYLSIGNWLFIHIAPDTFDKHPIGGAIPENLYIVGPFYDGLYLSLQKHLRTYEGLIADGATKPDDKELLRLIKK